MNATHHRVAQACGRAAWFVALMLAASGAVAQGAPSPAAASATPPPAASESLATPSPADAAFTTRLKRLETELRCLVCQNQTLADSSAPLAEDLRREVRTLATAGKDDDEIRAYLVARYGDFVLYSPPVKRTTWLLWFGPFALLASGAVAWWWIARQREVRAPLVAAADADALRRGLHELDGA